MSSRTCSAERLVCVASVLSSSSRIRCEAPDVVGVRAGEYGRQFPERGAENLAAIDALAEQGVIRPYVCATFPLERAIEAMRMLQDRKVIGKVVICP